MLHMPHIGRVGMFVGAPILVAAAMFFIWLPEGLTAAAASSLPEENLGQSKQSIQSFQSAWDAFVAIEPGVFRSSMFGNEASVEYAPSFRNLTGRTVSSIRFVTLFMDAGGTIKFQFRARLDQPIEPMQSSGAELYFFFSGIPEKPEEPYDILLPLAESQSGTQRVIIEQLTFADGEILKF